MFKLVVLCAIVASAVAEADPAILLNSPYAIPYGAAATYNTQYYPYTGAVSSSSFLQTPIAYSGAHLPLATHLIKKRSAQLLTPSYIAPTTYLANPGLSTPLISTPYLQTPYYAGAQLPLVNTHFIKKRSAEPQTFYPNTFLTPSTYINTVPATPYFSNPLFNNYYSGPATIPLATTHLIKKRSAEASAEPSAEASAEPSAEPSADPQFLVIPRTSYFGASPLYPSYAPTVIKSSPIFASNPFVYSTFIKK